MAEVAKGINPEITTEVTEEIKEATAEVVEKLTPNKGPQLVSLRETVSSESFEEKHAQQTSEEPRWLRDPGSSEPYSLSRIEETG